MKHIAMNITTGEVIETINGNHLKRCVAIAEHYNRKYNGVKGKWIFAHGSKAYDKMAIKVKKVL